MSEAWGKREPAAEVGRRDAIQLIVQRDEAVDPAAGVDQDERLLDMAAGVAAHPGEGPPEPAGPARVIFLRFWTNQPCIVVGRGYARRLPRLVERVGELPVLIGRAEAKWSYTDRVYSMWPLRCRHRCGRVRR